MRKIILTACFSIFCAFFITGQALAFSDVENACISGSNLIPLQIPIPGCDTTVLDQQKDPDREFCCNESRTMTIAVKDAPNYIAPFFRFGLIIASIMFVVLLVIGGMMYIGSHGAPDYISRARKLIRNSFIGLMLLMFSTVILYQINPVLLKLQLTTPETILPIRCCKVAGAGAVAPSNTKVTGTSGPSITRTPVAGGNTVVEIRSDGSCVTYFEGSDGSVGGAIECPPGTAGTTGGATTYASPEGSTSTTKPLPPSLSPSGGTQKDSYYWQSAIVKDGKTTYECNPGDSVEPKDYLCSVGEFEEGLDEATLAKLPKEGMKTAKINNQDVTGQVKFIDQLTQIDQEMKQAGKKGLTIVYSLRTNEEQAALRKLNGYTNDSQKPGFIVPSGYVDLNGKSWPAGSALPMVAPPGKSIHNTGLAVDVSNWQDAQPFMAKHGILNCLGSDKNHFSVGEYKKNPFNGYSPDSCK